MEPLVRPLMGLLDAGDEMRREQGRMLDRLGFGPRTTPSRTVCEQRGVRLLAYQPANVGQPAILLVPAPIKAAYIWDLASGASAVERFIGTGLQVYLMAWQRPTSEDGRRGLAQYAGEAIRECMEAISAEAAVAKVFLAGHSLGGTLAAIFSALHPKLVHGLVELEGPMAFGTGRVEAALTGAPSAAAITGALGNVPGSFLDWVSAYADPVAFSAEPCLDWLESRRSPAAHRLHWQVRRWSLDEMPMARGLFEDVQEHLYRENRFAEGRLRVGGRIADPRAIEAPVLAIVDPRSRIVPPASIEAYRTRTGSDEVDILQYSGDTGVVLQHVGVLVGRNAHRSLWPRISSWVHRQIATERA